MSSFISWSTVLGQHASDADNRKGSDPTESPRHFIDIDDIPEFNTTGHISQNLDTMILRYGSVFMNDVGILPWAILRTTDSLTYFFSQRNWTKAQLIAADLGHYVGDCHMPLHVCKNYNGQLTGQTGIHSRYESSMIGTYQAQLVYSPATAQYIGNRTDFVFNTIYENFKYSDSVLIADSLSKLATGSTSSTAYYDTLWKKTKSFTLFMFSSASSKLASLIYTAWKDAGRPDPATFVRMFGIAALPENIELYSYPNPFNNSAVIQYGVPDYVSASDAQLKYSLYSVGGEVVYERNIQERSPGMHTFNLKADFLPSGIYYGVLSAGNYRGVQKLLLMK